MKIYGNSAAVEQVANMVRNGREPHSIIIHGEKGLGKKTLAKYIASQLMCSEGSGIPCGKCRACRLLEKGGHPDLITARPNSNGNYVYSADDPDSVRQYISDAVVKPNEGNIKVYLIPDLDRSQVTTQIAVQNIFLKLIEEPPEHTAIIFTARSKEIFLPTIISRTLDLGVVNVRESESAEYLRENYPDRSHADIAGAVSAGRGNIGRCEAYLNREEFYAAAQTAKKIAAAAASGSEYEILRAFADADGKKTLLREAICLFSEVVRDSCVIRLCGRAEAVLTGCDSEAAVRLAERISAGAGTRLYDLLCEYVGRIDANCNLTLTVNSLAGQIAQII